MSSQSSPVSAREAMEIGMKIAEDHQTAVMEMAKHFPEVTLEKLLHGNKVWLAAQIMKAMQEAESRTSGHAQSSDLWRPMKSAPTDGTTIIICKADAEEPDPCTAHFRNGEWVCTTKEDWDAAEPDFRKYAWRLPEPTHWMPRPTPPQGPDTSTDRCICQDQHRRGYCTEPGCPHNMDRPAVPISSPDGNSK